MASLWRKSNIGGRLATTAEDGQASGDEGPAGSCRTANLEHAQIGWRVRVDGIAGSVDAQVKGRAIVSRSLRVGGAVIP